MSVDHSLEGSSSGALARLKRLRADGSGPDQVMLHIVAQRMPAWRCGSADFAARPLAILAASRSNPGNPVG
ncbi:MAG: hypothetical protein ACO3PV_10740 [Pseudohongiellaceae bacterium]|jgi:hypothetical protein